MDVFRVVRTGTTAHLVMDHPARKLNVLDEPALASLESALTELEGATGLTGVIVRSGKPGSFVAGADVDAIGSITDPALVRALVARGHQAFLRLSRLAVPTVAAIEGVCLGGGLEMALACDSRVAAEEKTQIGLPEVLLGIIPGFGGTTRLPRLVGFANALDLVLTGRTLDARRAEKMGVIAKAAPAAWLLEAAEARLARLARRPAALRRDRFAPRGLVPQLLEGNPVGHAIVFHQARSGVIARTGGHYPAPLAAIATMEKSDGLPIEQALQIELDAVVPLVTGAVCKNLVRIFHLSEAAKRAPVVADASVKPQPVARLALAGAGVMGGGIAELASRFGIEVRLRDVKPEALQKGLQTVRAVLDERGRRKRTPGREKDGQMARIVPTLELSGVVNADVAL